MNESVLPVKEWRVLQMPHFLVSLQHTLDAGGVLRDGAGELFGYLKAKKKIVTVVSTTPYRETVEWLENNGIRQLFSRIWPTLNQEWCKPNIGLWQEFLAQVQVSAVDCLVFEADRATYQNLTPFFPFCFLSADSDSFVRSLERLKQAE